MYTKKDILQDLDNLHPYKSFPNLDLSHFTIAGSRITLFADSTRWAIVIETIDPGIGGDMILYHFGNCLVNQSKKGLHGQFLSNISFFRLISQKEYDRIVIGPDSSLGLISKKINQVKVRDRFVRVEQNVKEYRKRGIPIQNFLNPEKHIDYSAMVRYLDEANPELFRATDAELKYLLPKDLPKLFVINEWHHKDYSILPTAEENVYRSVGDKPSSYQTFPLIADILVSKDTTKWRPALKPNNNWRNWLRKDD